MIRVRLFAALRELAGAGEVDVEAAEVHGVLEAMEKRFGRRFVEIMATGTVVVNGEIVGGDQMVGPSDEVALLPPVSGGSR